MKNTQDVESSGSARILLVEDNNINQIVAQQILKKSGFEADIASGGKEALEILSEQDYDLVLMDVQMPGMDGMETTRIIRDTSSSVRNHKVTVIAMTAYSAPEDQKMCLDAGMDDYISKPLVMDKFIKKIQEHLTP
jgi:CheY-like chemotaxis protein